MTRFFTDGLERLPDGRQVAPAASRNALAIYEVLADHLPPSGGMFEIASGTGQHAAHFAAVFPNWLWQPSEVDENRFASIRAWARASKGQIEEPVLFDASADPYPFAPDAILLVNVLHLMPAPVSEAIVKQAVRALSARGRGFFYGPFMRAGTYASDGDKRFDQSIRARDPVAGYVDDRAMESWINAAGGRVIERREMPANNLMWVFGG